MHKNRHLFTVPILSAGLLLILWLSMLALSTHPLVNQAAANRAVANQAVANQAVESPRAANEVTRYNHDASPGRLPASYSQQTITRLDSPTDALLLIDGIPALEIANAHLGQQKVSPDGRYLAVPLVPTGAETLPAGKVVVIEIASRQVVFETPGHTAAWIDLNGASAAASQHDLLGQIEVERLWSNGTSQRVRINLQRDHNGDSGNLIGQQLLIEALPQTRSALSASLISAQNPAPGSLQPPAYPESIRVSHHADNQCRNLQPGDVTVIPFEQYVARVVSSEVPASWSIEALKAQAVAVRTYAWYQIRFGQRDGYDVTDWADFQYMCDEIYESPGRAASETAGLYLTSIADPNENPVVAMYSAENSHPTLTNPNAPHLQSVPDLYSLGRTRSGHGYGLSQWGAQRRALDGHDFGQILGHYYASVYLRNALSPTQTIAAFVEPPGPQTLEDMDTVEGRLSSVGLQWRLITSGAELFAAVEISDTAAISNSLPISNGLPISNTVALTGTARFTQPTTSTRPAVTINITTNRALTYSQVLTTANPISQTVAPTETANLTENLALAGFPLATAVTTITTVTQRITESLAYTGAEGVWALPSQLVEGDTISITVQAGDEVLSKRRLVVDNTAPDPPRLTAIGPHLIEKQHAATRSEAISATVVISTHQATISGTAPTGAQVGASVGWRWDGEALIHTENSGEIIEDANAHSGQAWQAKAGIHQAGIWYGPYTNVLAAERAYRAIFWMHTPLTATQSPTALLSPEIIARLDVTDSEGRKVLGLHDLRIGDFQRRTLAGGYTPLAVDFYIFEPTEGVEFRVAWFGDRTLALDQVQIWTLPTQVDEQRFSFDLDLGHGVGERELSIATFDDAGNVSQAVTATVSSQDVEPPVLTNLNIPSNLPAGSPIVASVQAMDPFSGLDFASALLTLRNGDTVITQTAEIPPSSNLWRRHTLTYEQAQPLEPGVYDAQIMVTDLAGNNAMTEPRQVIIETSQGGDLFVPFFN